MRSGSLINCLLHPLVTISEGWRNPDWHVLHLPNERGRYQVYITSYRLFSAGESTKTYGGKGAALTSNIITLEVK